MLKKRNKQYITFTTFTKGFTNEQSAKKYKKEKNLKNSFLVYVNNTFKSVGLKDDDFGYYIKNSNEK